jgi:hypothetical protein
MERASKKSMFSGGGRRKERQRERMTLIPKPLQIIIFSKVKTTC